MLLVINSKVVMSVIYIAFLPWYLLYFYFIVFPHKGQYRHKNNYQGIISKPVLWKNTVSDVSKGLGQCTNEQNFINNKSQRTKKTIKCKNFMSDRLILLKAVCKWFLKTKRIPVDQIMLSNTFHHHSTKQEKSFFFYIKICCNGNGCCK